MYEQQISIRHSVTVTPLRVTMRSAALLASRCVTSFFFAKKSATHFFPLKNERSESKKSTSLPTRYFCLSDNYSPLKGLSDSDQTTITQIFIIVKYRIDDIIYHMSIESGFNNISAGEIFPSLALMQYLRDQFEDAYHKDTEEDIRGETAVHGRFHREVVLPGENLAPAGSWRIVMKPPHPRDVHGDRAEVYAICLRGTDGHLTADYTGLFADQFLIQDFENFQSLGYWLITDEGVFPASIQDFDDVLGFEQETSRDPLATLDLTETYLAKLSRYNIVASTDLQE